MADTVIRRAEPADLPALQTLWKTVFGDPPEFIQTFFAHFPPETSGWVVSRESEICSAAYLLTGNRLICNGQSHPCAYVYAVATPEALRGHGYASRLMRYFALMAETHGFALYTRPAEPGLFAWYGDVMGASGIGTGCEMIVHRDLHCEPSLPVQTERAAGYGSLREALLDGMPHVALSEAFLSLQAECSTLLKIGNGCAAAEIEDSTLLVKELFVPKVQREAAIQTLLQYFHLDTAIVRQQGEPEATQPITAFCPCPVQPDAPVNWGLFLD